MAIPEEVFTGSLLAWYRATGRDLPWRSTRDPYAILVSEIMLQQTQVGRVIERWTAWLERWATVEALAAAPLAEVITAWSGLGYNRRAVNLHRAAKAITAEGMPTTYEGLLRLPGVGPYTAGAVACFALGEDRVPIDVNVRRVLGRSIGSATITAPPGRAGDLTQAIFDLGATVCIARRPRCGVCPVADRCPSRGRTYEPERRQGPFEGSRRQRRGALLRALAAGPVPIEDVEAEIVLGLERDGLAVVDGSRITLPV